MSGDVEIVEPGPWGHVRPSGWSEEAVRDARKALDMISSGQSIRDVASAIARPYAHTWQMLNCQEIKDHYEIAKRIKCDFIADEALDNARKSLEDKDLAQSAAVFLRVAQWKTSVVARGSFVDPRDERRNDEARQAADVDNFLGELRARRGRLLPRPKDEPE